MNDVINNVIEKIKNPKILVAAGLVGIALICLSSFIGGGEKKESKAQCGETLTAEEYKAELQESIGEIVKSITGSDNLKVVITLESGIKYSYADISEGISENKTASNSESTSSELKQSYITVKTADGGEQALLVTTEMPEVRGVAIVCEGGDDEIINEKIQNAVTAALNITSKRVYIAGGKIQ
ncbi:MAG: hypothetical protein U0K70_05930 [Acutalibacteraceae bacterium]|nr:hypothetical protein [Acutalibacteraceae bacterium]